MKWLKTTLIQFIFYLAKKDIEEFSQAYGRELTDNEKRDIALETLNLRIHLETHWLIYLFALLDLILWRLP